jgi:glycosyltransferase involved in cell wall biosynthesis
VSASASNRPPRVLLACSGLDHARRGYESFARECFAALRGSEEIELELVKSSGATGPGERRVRTLRRDLPLTTTLGRALRRRPFSIEAFAFGWSLLPLLLRARPDLVYLSEWQTARVLAASRALTPLRFRILLCNGGFATGGFEHLDHVQELTPWGREYVLERGADPARHTALPLGFALPSTYAPPDERERRETRRRYGLPEDRELVISVAALNRSHKRLDYVIDELAALDDPPFLLMAGEEDAETSGLRELARARLPEGHAFVTVPAEEVPALLRASDVFVLASLYEMQARALIEALAYGLPCIAHDTPVTRFALGGHGLVGDLTRPEGLTALLARARAQPQDTRRDRAVRGHRHVLERFGWDALKPRYIELLCAVARPNSTVSSSTAPVLRTNS